MIVVVKSKSKRRSSSIGRLGEASTYLPSRTITSIVPPEFTKNFKMVGYDVSEPYLLRPILFIGFRRIGTSRAAEYHINIRAGMSYSGKDER